MTEAAAVITGGTPASEHLAPADRALVIEVYTKLCLVAEHLARAGRQLILQCATMTFNDHLNFPDLIAGPWLWEIKDSIPFGDVYLYSSPAGKPAEERKREGDFTVGNLILPH